MANNLKDHLKEVADAIRAKKGTSDLINPQDFATEIEGISGGGGLSYFAIDISKAGWDAAFAYGSFLAKVVLPEEVSIQPSTIILNNETLMSGLKAIATDINAEIYILGELMPLWGGLASTIQEFISMGVLSPITKEQFYDLNA